MFVIVIVLFCGKSPTVQAEVRTGPVAEAHPEHGRQRQSGRRHQGTPTLLWVDQLLFPRALV